MRVFGHGNGYTEQFYAEVNSLKPVKNGSVLPWSMYSENFDIASFKPEAHGPNLEEDDLKNFLEETKKHLGSKCLLNHLYNNRWETLARSNVPRLDQLRLFRAASRAYFPEPENHAPTLMRLGDHRLLSSPSLSFPL